MWDAQSLSIMWRSRIDSENGCFQQVAEAKEHSIIGTNNCFKIRTYTVLNTLSRECNFEISELRYCKTLS